ncbi:DUF6624 domain-containing protein [Nitrospirillum pindoramense]|uniref:Lysozyme inhibitor LprI N-terminal domain-containing protein n=1 Tax=Nitrospirillum amazonense TaxID=28077 RepID=A0A560GR29_9PROT|nr:DUF6624 domain-containing protein [Nitrospirillum amazonense]TWB36476.1 hypothetical protein FBZ90_11737 [Nitrospirillum amazonense]
MRLAPWLTAVCLLTPGAAIAQTMPPARPGPTIAAASAWVEEASTDCGQGPVCLGARSSLLNSAMAVFMGLPCADGGSCGPAEAALRDKATAVYTAVKAQSRDARMPLTADALADSGTDAAGFSATLDTWISTAQGDCGLGQRLCVLGQLWLLTQADQAARSGPPCDGMADCKAARLTLMRQTDQRLDAPKRRILALMPWPLSTTWGPAASNGAWLLVQHADADPAYQQRELGILLSQATLPPDERRHAAYLIDRLATASQREQVYGTQGWCDGKRWVSLPTRDPRHLDDRRHAVGMGPMAAYREEVARICQ